MYNDVKQYNPGAPGTATPPAKILAVCNALGIRQENIMQATSRAVYDSLPIDGRTTFNFFKGCNNRAFPFTNLSANKLDVGEAMVIEWITLSTCVAATPPIIDSSGNLFTAGNLELYNSVIDIEIANSQTVKDLSVAQFRMINNENSNYDGNEPYRLKTFIVIPSLQEFQAILKTLTATPVATGYMRLTLSGMGIITEQTRDYKK